MSQVEVRRKQIQAIISLLGVATWLILGRKIGYHGIAYLAVAVEVFRFFCILFEQKVSDISGKMIRSRFAKEQYKNADRIKSSILIFQGAAAMLGGILLFLLPHILTEKLFLIPYSTLALKILAPALILRVVTAIFLGYFQGSGTQMPTVAVSVIRQLLFLVLGLWFSGTFQAYGEKVKQLLLNEQLPAMYAATGVSVGLAVTECVVLLFTVLLYFVSRKSRMKKGEGLKRTETLLSSVEVFYHGMGLFVLAEIFFRLPVWIGIFLYQRSVQELLVGAVDYGKFYGGYLMICAIPILIGEAMIHPLTARIAYTVRKGEQHFAGKLLGAAFHSLLAYSLMITVFVAVMSSQVSVALAVSGEQSQAIAGMLRKGSSVIILALMLILFARIILYVGKITLVIAAGGIYAILYGIAMLVCRKLAVAGSDVLIYPLLISLVLTVVLLGGYLMRLLRVKIDFVYGICIPAAGALGAGILCYLLSAYVTPHLGYSFTMLLGLVISSIVYVLVLLFLHSFRKQELEVIPGGKLLLMLKDVLHIE